MNFVLIFFILYILDNKRQVRTLKRKLNRYILITALLKKYSIIRMIYIAVDIYSRKYKMIGISERPRKYINYLMYIPILVLGTAPLLLSDVIDDDINGLGVML